MSICKHGMPEGTCVICLRGMGLVSGSRIYLRSDHKDERKLASSHNWALVKMRRKDDKLDPSFNNLTEETRNVHCLGHLFVWAAEELVKKCPNLKKVQVIPTDFKKIGPATRKALEERGVSLVKGHYSPVHAWESERPLPLYKKQKDFFINLKAEAKKCFDELLRFEFESAQIASRYYCLSGEEYVPQRVLQEEFGYSELDTHTISTTINAIRHYLDPAFKVGKKSMSLVVALGRKVARLRKAASSRENFQKLCEELGFNADDLPEGLPLSRIELFAELTKAEKDGSLARLAEERPAHFEVIALRFGFSEKIGKRYLTLREVGDLTGRTRERVRQIEEKTLKRLGISDE